MRVCFGFRSVSGAVVFSWTIVSATPSTHHLSNKEPRNLCKVGRFSRGPLEVKLTFQVCRAIQDLLTIWGVRGDSCIQSNLPPDPVRLVTNFKTHALAGPSLLA